MHAHMCVCMCIILWQRRICLNWILGHFHPSCYSLSHLHVLYCWNLGSPNKPPLTIMFSIFLTPWGKLTLFVKAWVGVTVLKYLLNTDIYTHSSVLLSAFTREASFWSEWSWIQQLINAVVHNWSNWKISNCGMFASKQGIYISCSKAQGTMEKEVQRIEEAEVRKESCETHHSCGNLHKTGPITTSKCMGKGSRGPTSYWGTGCWGREHFLQRNSLWADKLSTLLFVDRFLNESGADQFD